MGKSKHSGGGAERARRRGAAARRGATAADSAGRERRPDRPSGPSSRRPEAGDREARGPGGDGRPAPWTGPWLLEWVKTVVFALIIFLFLRTFIVESFVISSGSMEPTLLVGDFLLVNKVALGASVPATGLRIPGYSEPERGDIIVFRADHAPGLDLVKRVAGVPGDTLAMVGGILHVNGTPQEEPYVVRDPTVNDMRHPDMQWQAAYVAAGVDRGTYAPTRDDWGPLVIPPERYFMLGDNREHSLDSRFWGLVERDKMKGAPFLIYYSYDQDALKPFRIITAARPGRIGLPPD